MFDTLSKGRLSELKCDDRPVALLVQKVLPELSTGDNKMLIFRTGWLQVAPGNAGETFENGFAVLNSERSRLKVFHFWDE